MPKEIFSLRLPLVQSKESAQWSIWHGRAGNFKLQRLRSGVDIHLLEPYPFCNLGSVRLSLRLSLSCRVTVTLYQLNLCIFECFIRGSFV